LFITHILKGCHFLFSYKQRQQCAESKVTSECLSWLSRMLTRPAVPASEPQPCSWVEQQPGLLTATGPALLTSLLCWAGLCPPSHTWSSFMGSGFKFH